MRMSIQEKRNAQMASSSLWLELRCLVGIRQQKKIKDYWRLIREECEFTLISQDVVLERSFNKNYLFP